MLSCYFCLRSEPECIASATICERLRFVRNHLDFPRLLPLTFSKHLIYAQFLLFASYPFLPIWLLHFCAAFSTSLLRVPLLFLCLFPSLAFHISCLLSFRFAPPLFSSCLLLPSLFRAPFSAVLVFSLLFSSLAFSALSLASPLLSLLLLLTVLASPLLRLMRPPFVRLLRLSHRPHTHTEASLCADQLLQLHESMCELNLAVKKDSLCEMASLLMLFHTLLGENTRYQLSYNLLLSLGWLDHPQVDAFSLLFLLLFLRAVRTPKLLGLIELVSFCMSKQFSAPRSNVRTSLSLSL